MIGRFPIYLDSAPKDEREKWEYVLGLIEKIDPSVRSFVENAPDGTLRVLGPFTVKTGECLVLCSPLPALFRLLVLTVPEHARAVIRPNSAFVEIDTVRSLFTEPGSYVLKIKDAENVSLKQLARDFRTFLGLNVKPNFILERMNVSPGKIFLTVRALDRPTAALLNFARYAGLGTNRKYGKGDVEVFRIAES